jgi:NDP-sugar pyrophosphorylase family protein
MNDIHLDSNCFISHSIIGRGSMIGNNFSGISGKTIIEIEGEFKELDHMGIMIGEDSIIKSHVVVDPGIIIGRKCKINPMNRITKPITSQSKVM